MSDLLAYQCEGRDWLANGKRRFLGDEMGLGKTPQIICGARKAGAKRVLVVCPAIGMYHWQREVEKWWPGTPVTVVDAPRVGLKERGFTIVSYERLVRRLDEFRAQRWDVFAPDEAHFAKNVGARRTAAVWSKEGVGWSSGALWPLSGTPAPNHAGELWPWLRAFGAVKMGYQQYVDHFCVTDWQGRVKGTDIRAVPELRAILDPYLLRRKKKDVASHMPTLTAHPWYVEGSTDFLDLALPIPALRESFFAQLRMEEQKLRRNLLACKSDAERLHVVAADAPRCGHYPMVRRYTGLLKAPAVLQTIEFEIENKLLDCVVVFGIHREVLYTMHQLLKNKGHKVELVWGGTNPRAKDAAVKRFQQGESNIFLGNLVACGTTIDLTVANQGIILESDWVPGNNAQAMMRMDRYGQTEPMTFRIATLRNSIDELINAAVERKTNELTQLL